MIAKKIAKKKVGFAVVGLGLIAQGSALPAFANCRKATLVALVSRNAGKAARLLRKFAAGTHDVTDEYAECMVNPDVPFPFDEDRQVVGTIGKRRILRSFKVTDGFP